MRHRRNLFRDKGFLAMAGVTVLALAAIAGGSLINHSSNEPDTSKIADLNDDKNIAANNDATKATKDNEDNIQNQTSGYTDKTPAKNTIDTSEKETSEQETPTNSLSSDNSDAFGELSEAGVSVSGFTFTADSTLIWPVETNDIIIDYSPDSTIYFPTLDKYKTSDAVSIRSAVGTPVYASAAGTICDIGYNEEIGNSVSLNLGSGYTLQYGQIKDIQVEEGDVVSEGDLLCYVASPTKYYAVEGPNLYLKLTSDGTSVDPLDYLNFD